MIGRVTKIRIAIGFVIVAGAAGYYFLHSSARQPLVDAAATATSTLSAVESTARAAAPVSRPTTNDTGQGKRNYSNGTFHFSILYPDTLSAKEYKEQGGALTVSFQDANPNEGFEVYIAPYTDKQITAQRFKMDEPSGAFVQPTDVLVDGTPGTMFFGHNAMMGDTREVWFIHRGFLYEVATYKELDTWLAGIMQTRKFI